MTKKITDADIMTGFNPAYGKSAEEIEAAQDDAEGAVEGAEAESGSTEPAENDSSDATAASDSDDLVDVKLDGRVLKAPKDIAEAFTREINRRDGTRGAELQQLRERLAHLEGRVTARPDSDAEPEKTPEPQLPDPDLAIENKDEYQRQLDAYITHQQEKRLAALAREQEQATAAQKAEERRVAAWNAHVEAFYARPENKVLVGNEDIVDAVLEKHRATLSTLSVEEGFEMLGKLAKERLAKVTGQAPEVKARTVSRPPNLEGSSRRSAAVRPVAEKDDGPGSLTQALKQRRRTAAAAFTKGGSRAA